MINRRDFALGAVLGAGTAAMSGAADASVVASPAKNVVLVHGLFADASCWLDVIPALQAAGLNVTALQNPLTSFAETMAATTRVLDRQDGLTVLVGHSFSGMIVTGAGVHPKVSAWSMSPPARPMPAKTIQLSPRASRPHPRRRGSSMMAMRGA